METRERPTPNSDLNWPKENAQTIAGDGKKILTNETTTFLPDLQPKKMKKN